MRPNPSVAFPGGTVLGDRKQTELPSLRYHGLRLRHMQQGLNLHTFIRLCAWGISEHSWNEHLFQFPGRRMRLFHRHHNCQRMVAALTTEAKTGDHAHSPVFLYPWTQGKSRWFDIFTQSWGSNWEPHECKANTQSLSYALSPIILQIKFTIFT